MVFSASLNFNSKESSCFFKLKLDPLKLDKSHRLGRRFGHDRFLEVSLPLLSETGDIPEALKTERGPEIIYQWLVSNSHMLAGRSWQPFFVKPKEKKKRNQGTIIKDLEELEASFQLYFFATDGVGFIHEQPTNPWPSIGHAVMPLTRLLDQIRPTKENENQSYLKLFARISLS